MAVTYKKRRLVVATPPQGGGAPAGYAYSLDNDNSIALDSDGARGMEAA